MFLFKCAPQSNEERTINFKKKKREEKKLHDFVPAIATETKYFLPLKLVIYRDCTNKMKVCNRAQNRKKTREVRK